MFVTLYFSALDGRWGAIVISIDRYSWTGNYFHLIETNPIFFEIDQNVANIPNS